MNNKLFNNSLGFRERRLSEHQLSLVPYPKKVKIYEGFFDLSAAVLLYEDFDNDAVFMVEQIAMRSLEACGKRPVISSKHCVNMSKVVYLWDNSISDEGYILQIMDDKIVIKASTKQGRFYGAMTLCQLIMPDGTVPHMDVEDWPDYSIRAISDDISRGQVSTIDHFKKIIRFCGEYKINTYILYIEDLYQFCCNPRIGRDRGALTLMEIKELERYAQLWHVELMPLFESLGHQERIVELPEYIELREGEGSYSFNPVDPRVLQLMESFYKELAGAFASPNIFAGLDETGDIGKGRSKEVIEELGHAKVYAQYYNGLYRIARKLGKRLWIYATMAIDHPDSLDMIDKDIIMVNYTFKAPDSGDPWWDNLYKYIPVLVQKGFAEIVSPSIMNFKRIFPDYQEAWIITSCLNRIGAECGCTGSMIASWADEGGENFREYNWYGYAMQSELSWNAKEPISQEIFAPRFGATFFGIGYEDFGNAIMNLGKAESAFEGGIYEFLWNLKDKFEMDINKQVASVKKTKDYIDMFWNYWDKSNQTSQFRRNGDNLAFMVFAAHRVEYVLNLVTNIDYIRSITKDSLNNHANGKQVLEAIQSIADIIDHLINEMECFRGEFQALWMSACRIEGLDYNLNRVDEFIKSLKEFKAHQIKKMDFNH